MFLPRGERGEGLSGLPVVCHGEPVTGEHLLAAAEASRGKASGTQSGERREARGEREFLLIGRNLRGERRERVFTESERKNLYRNLKTDNVFFFFFFLNNTQYDDVLLKK